MHQLIHSQNSTSCQLQKSPSRSPIITPHEHRHCHQPSEHGMRRGLNDRDAFNRSRPH